MNRCLACGRVNRPQSAFCQDCGKPLGGEAAAPAPRVRPPTPVAGVPIGATCPTCRTVNAPGMQFCKMCGTRLAAAPGAPPAQPPSQPPVPPAAHTQAFTCGNCGKPTPAGYVFCQNCGTRLEAAGPPAPQPPVIPPVGPLSGPKPLVLSTLPGAPTPRPSAAGAPAPAAPAAASDPMASTFRSDANAAIATVTSAWGALVRVHVDGRDGPRTQLVDKEVVIGREQGAFLFPDDRYLAARHAVLDKHAGGARLRVLDETNGVYLRLREPHLLVDGDTFLVGQQVFRFEVPVTSESSAQPLVQHGVCLFGTPARSAWGRLRQLTTSGHTRDVIHLARPEVVVGREAGDHCFADDEFMSRRHAALTGNGGRPTLADLGSSNGTYVRVRGELILRHGDIFRLGDQLLRFEQA